MNILPLTDFKFEEIYKAFSEAFQDYDFQLTKNELKNMLQRRGFVADLSFAAVEGDTIVSFTLNGIGLFNNLKTAYDTGTGTIPAFRGKSLATKIFEYSLPYLKKAGINQYLLEVLQHNSKAVKIYKNIGFEVSREFNYFVKETTGINFRNKQFNNSIMCQLIDFEQCGLLTSQMEFNPSWQNSFEAIGRQADKFISIGAFIDEMFVGYCITEPQSGDITQLLVKSDHRRKGAGTILLKNALKHNKCNSIKLINADVECQSLTSFLANFSVRASGKQFEMIKQLNEK
ncbi:MAG: GNAT family N-acetyltransferase [Bacteroidales bacterium]|nr:GNAT family N-acetyltransferase [Bacteroidales bacterium]